MLFWLFVIFLVVGIVLLVLSGYDFDCKVLVKHPILKWFYSNFAVTLVGTIITFIAGICVIFSLVIFFGCYSDVDAYVEKNNVRYRCLCYKLQSEKARDEFGLVNKEIVDEIQDWNEDVVYYQTIQDNFWVGIYYPNVYDQFEVIEFE